MQLSSRSRARAPYGTGQTLASQQLRRGEERKCGESHSRVAQGKYRPGPCRKPVLFSCSVRSSALRGPLDHLRPLADDRFPLHAADHHPFTPPTNTPRCVKSRLILPLLSSQYNRPVTRPLARHTFSHSACVSIRRNPTGGRRFPQRTIHSSPAESPTCSGLSHETGSS